MFNIKSLPGLWINDVRGQGCRCEAAQVNKMARSWHAPSKHRCFFIALLLSMALLAGFWSMTLQVKKPLVSHEIDVKTSTGVQHTNIEYRQVEEIRRQVAESIHTTQLFLRARLQKLSKSVASKDAFEVEALVSEAEDRLRVMQHDLANLDSLLELTSWRERQASSLSRKVQRRISALQNPPDCASAKKIVCEMSRSAGAGSLIHHLVYCIMAAYGSGKTFVLQSKGWRYSPKGWEVIFQPLSRSCVKVFSDTIDPWPGTNQSEAVMFQQWDKPVPKPVHQPMAVPEDIASSLINFHEMPSAWWVGQFIAYMMRLQPKMQQAIDQVKMEIGFDSPIVGVHIRRTDKKVEARLYPLEEYMVHVENYFLGLDMSSPSGGPVPRRVILASELSSLITEARAKYPNYKFYWHNNTAERAQKRYNLAAFKDFVTELHLLAHSDYLVCTFSSNVCRLAFEMMQSLRVDAPSRVISLDTNYFFHQARPRLLSVRFPHHPDKYAKKDGFTEAEAGQELRASTKNVLGTGYTVVMVPDKKNRMAKRYIPDYKVREILDIVNVTLPDFAVNPGELEEN